MLRERGIQRRPGARRASSASSRSSRHEPRAASAPGTLTASQMAANRRCRRILASSARSAELISCWARRSRPARSPPHPLWSPCGRCPGFPELGAAPRSISNRATRPPRALTSPRPTSTVSRFPGSDSTASCNSVIASRATHMINTPEFISLLLTILSRSLATTTRSPYRDITAAACPGEGPHPGPAIRIGARPAAGWPQAPATTLWSLARRSETARPVNENGLPPTPRRYRQPRPTPHQTPAWTPTAHLPGTPARAPHQRPALAAAPGTPLPSAPHQSRLPAPIRVVATLLGL